MEQNINQPQIINEILNNRSRYPFLSELGIYEINAGSSIGSTWSSSYEKKELLTVRTPIDNTIIAQVALADSYDLQKVIETAETSFRSWKLIPAPKRGEIIRQIGNEIRLKKDALGKLITLEMGKILPEGIGEVQEGIDIADFAVGLSRQLYGKTMHSERPHHRLYEQWHPLGIIGVITAFNFPFAVWSWNAMIAGVAGNTIIWKPSSKTPLTAIATQNIVNTVLAKHHLEGVFNLVIGSGKSIGDQLINDKRIPLISATGSTQMGKHIAQVSSSRLAQNILELGGNNAVIVAEDANIDLVLRSVLFGAIGTAGQRCTTIRRIIVHQSMVDNFVEKLKYLYSQIRIGNPLEPGILMGPVIDQHAVQQMLAALEVAKEQGGIIIYGGGQHPAGNCFVVPAIVKVPNNIPIVKEETFAPIVYIMEYKSLQEAIDLQNDVSQGLSSAIFTQSITNMEMFLSHSGSDCGLANVNIGTSGAEIGGAFGGEKDTGYGREAGSDAWKQYMRRQTVTINWGSDAPLSQGISFD